MKTDSELVDLIENVVSSCINKQETVLLDEKDKFGFLVACEQILEIIQSLRQERLNKIGA